MKKTSILFTAIVIVVSIFSSAFISSFDVKGGDVFEVYLNGKQLHQQFIHVDKSIKTLQLSELSSADKIQVMYSHCGVTGKERILTVRNEKNELIKEFKYADSDAKRSIMNFNWKDISGSKNKTSKLNLYYYSKEIPAGKMLMSFTWKESSSMAKI